MTVAQARTVTQSTLMLAAVLKKPASLRENPLSIEEVPMPIRREGEPLLKVLACGVCRTDIHIAEGDLPQKRRN